MIKINVIVKDKIWLKYIKNPEIYLKKRLKQFTSFYHAINLKNKVLNLKD